MAFMQPVHLAAGDAGAPDERGRGSLGRLSDGCRENARTGSAGGIWRGRSVRLALAVVKAKVVCAGGSGVRGKPGDSLQREKQQLLMYPSCASPCTAHVFTAATRTAWEQIVALVLAELACLGWSLGCCWNPECRGPWAGPAKHFLCPGVTHGPLPSSYAPGWHSSSCAPPAVGLFRHSL